MRNIRLEKKQKQIQLFSARAYQGVGACFSGAKITDFATIEK